jgi:putative oxidoreductase
MALLQGLAQYRNTGLLIMRVGLGIMMIMHGYPKLFGGTEKWEKIGGAMTNIGIDFAPTFWGFMAATAEGVGGVLILLGLFFRPTCILIIFTMIIAAITHLSKGDGLMGASHAIELAFAFAGLLVLGAGKYSVDKS